MFKSLFSSGVASKTTPPSNANAKKVNARVGEVPSVDLRLWSHGGCTATACAFDFDAVQRLLAVRETWPCVGHDAHLLTPSESTAATF